MNRELTAFAAGGVLVAGLFGVAKNRKQRKAARDFDLMVNRAAKGILVVKYERDPNLDKLMDQIKFEEIMKRNF